MFGQEENRDEGRGEPYLLRWPLQFSQKTRQSPWQTPEQLHWGPHKWRDQCRSSSLGSLIGWDKQVNIPDRIQFTAIPMSPAPRVFLGEALLLIRLRLTSSVQSLLPGSPYLSFPWTTLVLCPLLLLHIFSLSMLWMKGGTDYLQVTDRDQFLRQARTEGKEADWCQPNALAEKRWWNGRVDINIYQLDNFPEWRPPLRL